MARGRRPTNGLTATIRIDGYNDVMAAFRRLPLDVEEAMEETSRRVADREVVRLRAAAAADSPQSALMVPTIKRKPGHRLGIMAGGATRVGSSRKPADKILFGSEFGSNKFKQFRPFRFRSSYWLFATLKADEGSISREWNQAADDVIREWSH